MEQNQLFLDIEKEEVRKYPKLEHCIKDGVLYPSDYNVSNFRIVFILKEPYAHWDKVTNAPCNCYFTFSDITKNMKHHYERLNKTWKKVAAISYSLKTNSKYSEHLTYEQTVEGLKCVCWINLSKTPWKTNTNKDKQYKQRVRTWEPLVKLQLQELQSTGFNIVFYGNTWDDSIINPIEPNVEWCPNFENGKKEYVNERQKRYSITISKYKNTYKILVNGYHPGFGNSAEWQTNCIKEYMKEHGIQILDTER